MSVGRAGAGGAGSPGGRGGSQEGDRSQQEAAEEEAPRQGLAQRPGLKDDALGKWRERSNGGRRAGEGSAGETAGGPGRGAAGPPFRARRGPGLPEPARGATGLGGGRTGAGPPQEGAGRRRHPRARFPPSTRPHLPSLAFLFPSALRARRPGALLPFPWGAQPGSSRLRFPPRPGATVGASDAGAAMGYEAPCPGGAGA